VRLDGVLVREFHADDIAVGQQNAALPHVRELVARISQLFG